MNRLFRLARLGAFLFVIVTVLWSLGLAWFTTLTARVADNVNAPLDGIVVLTGGSERIKASLTLLDEDKGKRLLISGVNPDVSSAALARTQGVTAEQLACCIDIGRTATDTITNAEEARAWASDHAVNSIWLVTADYHMPRALVLFQDAMPEMEIHPWPVEAPVSFRYFITEYHKFLITLVRSGRLADEAPQED